MEVMLFLKGVQNHQIRLKQFCSSQKYLNFHTDESERIQKLQICFKAMLRKSIQFKIMFRI